MNDPELRPPHLHYPTDDWTRNNFGLPHKSLVPLSIVRNVADQRQYKFRLAQKYSTHYPWSPNGDALITYEETYGTSYLFRNDNTTPETLNHGLYEAMWLNSASLLLVGLRRSVQELQVYNLDTGDYTTLIPGLKGYSVGKTEGHITQSNKLLLTKVEGSDVLCKLVIIVPHALESSAVIYSFVLRGEGHRFNTATVSESGKHVVVLSSSGTVVYTIRDGKANGRRVLHPRGHHGLVTTDAEGRDILVQIGYILSDGARVVISWDLETGESRILYGEKGKYTNDYRSQYKSLVGHVGHAPPGWVFISMGIDDKGPHTCGFLKTDGSKQYIPVAYTFDFQKQYHLQAHGVARRDGKRVIITGAYQEKYRSGIVIDTSSIDLGITTPDPVPEPPPTPIPDPPPNTGRTMEFYLSTTMSFGVPDDDRLALRNSMTKDVIQAYGEHVNGIWATFQWKELLNRDHIRRRLIPAILYANERALKYKINIRDRNFGSNRWKVPIPAEVRKLGTWYASHIHHGAVWDPRYVDAQLALVRMIAEEIQAERQRGVGIALHGLEFMESSIVLPSGVNRSTYTSSLIRLHSEAARILEPIGCRVAANINWYANSLEKVGALIQAMPEEVDITTPDTAPGMFVDVDHLLTRKPLNLHKVHALQIIQRESSIDETFGARVAPHIESAAMRVEDYYDSLVLNYYVLKSREVSIRSVFTSDEDERTLGFWEFARELKPQIERFKAKIGASPAPDPTPTPDPDPVPPPTPDPDPTPTPDPDPEPEPQPDPTPTPAPVPSREDMLALMGALIVFLENISDSLNASAIVTQTNKQSVDELRAALAALKAKHEPQD